MNSEILCDADRFAGHLFVFLVYKCNGVFTVPDTETNTETDKNGFCRIVWRCSYCPERDTNTESHCLLYPFSLSGSVNVPIFVK